MSHALDPHPDPTGARAMHPSMSSLSDADAALALAGRRTTTAGVGAHRRRKAWPRSGNHGSPTLLGAHRSAPGDWTPAPPAA